MDSTSVPRLCVENTAARKRKRSTSLQEYRNVAASLFAVERGGTANRDFLQAAKDGESKRIEEFLQRRNETLINIDFRDAETGNTAIIWAAKRGHVKIVQLLLRSGVDVTLRNYEGQTALEVASPQLQQLLLDAVDKGEPHRNLLQAAWQGNACLVKKILSDSRVDVNCKNTDGLTPLLLVTRDAQLFERLSDRAVKEYDPVEVMEQLLDYGADLNMEDEEGKTALHYASSSRAQLSPCLVEMLLHDGCDTDVKDRRAFTPIHCASQTGNVDVVEALLEGGSDANIRGYAGTTPLHVSAMNGHDHVACTLLNSGADVTLVDDSGLTAVDVAKTKKVKNTLKEAWAAATHRKAEKILNPLKKSGELRSPIHTPKGQVIFDFPVSRSSACAPRILKTLHADREAPVTVSLINLSLAASCNSPVTPRKASEAALSRHLVNIERARIASEQMNKDLSDVCVPSPYASQVRGRTPRTGQGKLTPIKSPRKGSASSQIDLQISASSSTSRSRMDDMCQDADISALRRSKLKKSYSHPANQQIPVTIVGLDMGENLQDMRVKQPVYGCSGYVRHRKGQRRRQSDTGEYGLHEHDDIFLKGRSHSKLSLTSVNEDANEFDERCQQLRTPSATGRVRVPETIEEALSPGRNSCDLERAHAAGGSQQQSSVDSPTHVKALVAASRVLQADASDSDYASDQKVMDSSQGPVLSSQESSPRTDEEIGRQEPVLDKESGTGKTRDKPKVGKTTDNSKNSRVSKDTETSENELRNSNDSGCSVKSTSEKNPFSQGEARVNYSNPQTEYQRQDKVAERPINKTKLTASKSGSKSRSDTKIAKTDKTKASGTDVTQTQTKRPGSNTHVSVVKAPTSQNDTIKDNPTDLPKPPQDLSAAPAVVTTYQTTLKAPSDKLNNKKCVDKVDEKANEKTACENHARQKSAGFRRANSRGCPHYLKKRAPLPRAGKQNSSSLKNKTTCRSVRSEFSPVNDKHGSNATRPTVTKNCVPKQRPPSARTKSLKEQETPKKSETVSNSTTSRPSSSAQKQKTDQPQTTNKETAVPYVLQGTTQEMPVTTKAQKTTKSTAPEIKDMNKEEGKDASSRPRSVKAKLIKVASGEEVKQNVEPTEAVQRTTQEEKPRCKITLNGRENTIPEYNPNTLDLQEINSSFKPQSHALTSGGAAAKTVKVTKVGSEGAGVSRDEPGIEFVKKPQSAEHDGPVIWDPFEKIREQNQKFTQSECKKDEGELRTKSARGNASRLAVPKASASSRNSSATKRSAKSKADAVRKSRPKSERKPKTGKTKTGSGGKESGSGIGWHLDYDEAPTFTKVKSFKEKPNGDLTSDEEDVSTYVVHSSRGGKDTWRKIGSELPNMVGVEDLEEYTSADDSDDSQYIDVDDGPQDDDDTAASASQNFTPKAVATKVAVATRVRLEKTSLGSSQEADETALPGVETVKYSRKQSAEFSSSRVEVVSVKSTEEGSTQSEGNAGLNYNLQYYQECGKKQVSHPILPGASVPEKKGSFKKTASRELMATGSHGECEKTKEKSGKVEKDKRKSETPASRENDPSKLENKKNKAKKKSARGDRTVRERKASAKKRTKEHEGDAKVGNSNEELKEIIDEIIKSTPNPTTSFLSKDLDAGGGDGTKKPRKHSRETFEKEMRSSHDGKSFKQIQDSASSHGDGGSDGTSWHSGSSVSGSSAADEDVPEELDINSDETEELKRLINSLKNMELVVLPGNEEPLQSEIKTPARSRPPLPRKHQGSSASFPGNDVEEESDSRVAGSPRFVRKRDSLRNSANKDVKFCGNSFRLESGTLTGNFADVTFDEDLFPDDSRIVTNRMGGRRSAAGSRCSSSLNSTLRDENVETIQWKRGNQLGKGAYGTVWCGLTNGGELIAVKQIELNTADMDVAEEEYTKIHEEVDLLKTLNHNNIVGYLGTSLEDNIVSIFMEFVPGGSIGSLLARFGSLEEQVFGLYTKQILEGVEYLHANRVIHRDIKGGNIMLMPNGVIKLIDFGCAKRLCLNVNAGNSSHGSSRLLKSMRGTPYWMAPEVVKEIGYGTKSDIWSIGCTVFEMATRKPPWAEVPPMAAIFAIGSNKPVPQLLGKFSQDARDFVHLCLTRDQKSRPDATQLLQHAFIVRKNAKKR